MLYFLVPWSAINLVDYYWVRRGRYSVLEIFSNRSSMYGRWAWRGLTAYLLGFLAMVPFFALPFFTGPAARALGGIDISIIFGLLVSALVYYLLARSINAGRGSSLSRESGRSGTDRYPGATCVDRRRRSGADVGLTIGRDRRAAAVMNVTARPGFFIPEGAA